MPSSPRPSVVLNDLSYSWPDGSPLLDRVNGSFGPGRTGLVGLNGAGKSTLLRLVAGLLAPDAGSITTSGPVGYLPQFRPTAPDATLVDLVGVRRSLDALRRIESGDTDPALFDLVGDDWDLADRTAAALASAGSAVTDLDRPVGELSGGQAMLAAVVGVQLGRPSVALLDEPTNNLDAAARERVRDVILGWRGALIVVSHDLELLEAMDAIAELRAGALTTYGGPYSSYREQLSAEQQAAQRDLRAAEQQLRTEKRQRVETEERITHSERQGRKDAANRRYITAVVHDRRNSAEKAQASRRGLHDGRMEAAQRAVDAADRRVRSDARIVIDLPDPQVPSGRRLATLTGSDGRETVIQGPERVALTGPNGVGKSTLVRRLTGLPGQAPGPGHPEAQAHSDRLGYLPQDLSTLRPDWSVIDNVRPSAAALPDRDLRNQLARLLLRGGAVDRAVDALSGGERFRAALAQLLLRDPPAELVILDEPTNNLDIESVRQLVEALDSYRGALLVVSHDRAFLDALGLDRELQLDEWGCLREVG